MADVTKKPHEPVRGPVKPALLRVIAFLERRVIEEPEHRESAKYEFISAELEALYEWITDDEPEDA
jgi:hypothetical protein